MSVQTFTSPSGDLMVVLPHSEYQDLLDASRHEAAMREIAAGRLELLTAEETAAFIAEPSPLRFWRHKRGVSQAALAALVGISQAYLAQVEAGVRAGSTRLFAKLARALSVRIEDLISEG